MYCNQEHHIIFSPFKLNAGFESNKCWKTIHAPKVGFERN